MTVLSCLDCLVYLGGLTGSCMFAYLGQRILASIFLLLSAGTEKKGSGPPVVSVFQPAGGLSPLISTSLGTQHSLCTLISMASLELFLEKRIYAEPSANKPIQHSNCC